VPVSVGELLAYLRLDSSSFDRGIRVAQTEMRTATGAADRMGAAVGTTSERLTGAGRSAQVAASGSAKYRAAQLSLVAAQERYNTVLNQGNASTAKLASAEAAVIRANDRVAVSSRAATTAVSELGAAQERGNAIAATTPGLMMRTASGFTHAARSAVGLGAAFGAFELAKKAIDISKDASKFQQSMLLIQTNANAGAAEVKNMTDAVLTMSPEVATKPLDLANALYHVEQNGLRGQKALEALRAGAEGAKIGLADVEDTTNTMTIAVASGIHGMGSLQRAMGTMIAIAGTGDMRLKDLNEALSGGVLTNAKNYGASLQDVAAVLATFGDNGIRGADAATQLRMVLMGFAKPAAAGKKALDGIGLSMTDLRDEMQKHGLVAALNDLEQHMTAAGITGAKVGGFITEAFGKKAGAGLGVLMGEIDRVNNKFEEGAKGGASFGAKWEATTKTTAFAFQKLGAEFEAAGIKLMQSIGPAAANAANWLGTTLPHAISTLAHVLGPTASLVGTVFVGAWHALSAVLSVVGSALAGVGGFLSDHKTLVTGVATAVLGMWAAYKAFTIGVAALRAIDLALGALAMRMNRMGGAMAAMRGGLSSISTSALAGGFALAGLGLIIAGVVTAQQEHARQVALDRAAVEGFTSAIEADRGALGAHTRALIEDNLAKADAYQKALKLGISQKTLTDAVMGNAGAMAQVKAAIDGAKSSQFDLAVAIGEQVPLLAKGAQNAKDKAAADSKGAGSAKKAAAATIEQASAAKRAADAEKAAANAAKALDAALQALSGNLGSRQALDQYRQSVQQLKSNLDKSNHSIRGNSVAAVSNRLALDNVVQGVLQYASALKQQGKTAPQIASAMQTQLRYLISHATQLGLNKQALKEYLHTLGLTPHQVGTKMTLDDGAARAKAKAFQDYLNSLHATIALQASFKRGDPGLPGRASGGGLPEGVSAVGEQGPELAVKSGPNVHILSNPQSKAYLSATGMTAPGFASGTLNPHAFQTSLGKDASSERYAFQQLLAIGTKAGISSGLAKQLKDENKLLGTEITVRNRLADKLGRDNQRLADAQKRLADEAAAVKGAITGSFDITSAGTGFDGQQPITGLNMLAQLKQSANRAKAFVAAIKALKGKVGAGYLYQLAEKGPDALPEAQALGSLNKSDLSAFSAATASLNTSGNQLGSYIGGMRFGGEVRRDKATVAADKARLHAENKSIDHLGNRIVKQLENGIHHLSNPKITVYLDGKKIATAVAQGAKKNGVRS
jgi:TP901 family phage tail tape measure protein